MKPDNSLDRFICNALKSDGGENLSVDWSEVEVLLRHEQKQVSLPNPKYFLIGGGAVALIAVIFLLIKLAESSHNSTQEKNISADTATVISTPDSTVNISPVTSVPADTAKNTGTINQISNVPAKDTARPAFLPAEKTAEKKKTDSAEAVNKEPVKPVKKKNKLSSLAPDTLKREEAPESILPPEVPENKSEEIKNNPPINPDTVKTPSPKKTGKSKKGKVKADTTPSLSPAKADSLK
jgi:hypothetical protein